MTKARPTNHIRTGRLEVFWELGTVLENGDFL